jgi:hypothetical protein
MFSVLDLLATYRYTLDEISDACKYLEGKQLVETKRAENAVLGINRAISHVTPFGIDVLEGSASVEGIEL